jgi:maleamate amidohydrolase
MSVTDKGGFEDHCWKDVVEAEILEACGKKYERKLHIGKNPALLAIDLYNRVYEGGNRPVRELVAKYPSACGEYGFQAIPPTQRLFAAARKAGIPIVYTTGAPEQKGKLRSRNLQVDQPATNLDPYGIREEFKPQDGDRMIYKERASGFFGTPLEAYLRGVGVDSLIVCGESTSGCVRASVVEGCAHSFHMAVVEECVFDRILVTHKINLFDLHHKYADVLRVNEAIEQLEAR